MGRWADGGATWWGCQNSCLIPCTHYLLLSCQRPKLGAFRERLGNQPMSHRRPESHPPHHPRRVSCLPSAWGSSSPVTQGSGLTAGHKESDMTEWLTTFTLHVGDHVIHCLKQDTLESKNGQQGPQMLTWHEVTVAKLLSSLMPWASESKQNSFFF